MTSLSERVFGRCSAQSDYYRAVIEIDNDFVPQEIADLWAERDTLRADTPEFLKPNLQRFFELMMLRGGRLRAYRRRHLSDNVLHFESEPPEPPGRRVLLVCFAGNANRMMLPTATLLQHLPREHVDVVMFRDPLGLSYLRGVPGYADNLFDAMRKLASDLEWSRYRKVLCLGTSGGGAAALYGAILGGAAAALCVGGHHPTQAKRSAGRLESEGITGEELDQLVQQHAPASAARPVMHAIYAHLHESDRQGAFSLRDRLPGCMALAIRDLDTHALMMHLCTTNQLAGVLDGLLFRRTRPSTMELPDNPRALALAALEANPVIVMSRAQLEHLANGGEVSFDALEMDSLARMELSIWLELNVGLVLTEAEIGELASFQGLAERLSRR